MTKEEFLLDMIEYYATDPSRRSVSPESRCTYYPAHNNTEGCAIGRHLPESGQKLYDGLGVYSSIVEEIISGGVNDHRPKWMKDLPVPFLCDCQELHDGSEHWTSTGLSVKGKDCLRNLITSYLIDLNKFQKFLQ